MLELEPLLIRHLVLVANVVVAVQPLQLVEQLYRQLFEIARAFRLRHLFAFVYAHDLLDEFGMLDCFLQDLLEDFVVERFGKHWFLKGVRLVGLRMLKRLNCALGTEGCEFHLVHI